MTDDDVNAMFGPKLDALALLHTLSLRTAVRSSLLFCRSRVCLVHGGSPTTRRPALSSTLRLMPAATSVFRPPS